MKAPGNFDCHDLGDGCTFFTGALPSEFLPRHFRFETLWEMHPAEYHEIKMHGRLVRTPRWQQAYGMDYHYTGRVNKALPLPPMLEPLLAWAKEAIDSRLNGILVNWYDGKFGHYIGRHRDSTANLVTGAPIVTISFGEERIFRLRPWPTKRGEERIDFEARNGTIFIMPFATNLSWTHEVPASRKWTGKRISVTLRAFSDSSGATTVKSDPIEELSAAGSSRSAMSPTQALSDSPTAGESEPDRFFTIGYGGRDPASFLALLEKHKIRAVVDVRLQPHRASMGSYVKANSPERGIARLLQNGGIAYRWLPELGNIFLDYPDWHSRYEMLWQRSGDLLIERLTKIPAPFCLLCAERDVSRCHRKAIADFLVQRNWQVEHLP